jgi:non-ribosomal peptide synthetase component F
MVGSFFNLVPLRTDVAGCAGLREIVARVRATCLAAYAHEIPFVHLLETAPELMLPAAGEHHAACVFQVVQSPFTMHRHLIGDLRFTAMRRRLLSQPVGSQIPDGALWAMELDATGGIVGSIGYCSGQFAELTIVEMVAGYCEVLRRLIAAPDRW